MSVEHVCRSVRRRRAEGRNSRAQSERAQSDECGDGGSTEDEIVDK